MFTLYALFYLSDTNTPRRRYWLQLPLLIARRPSRSNGGAPVLAPMVALLFRRVLTFVRPTPIPPTPHQFHPSHSSLVCINQPANGGAPVLALLFRRALTTVRPTPVPPTPHPVHLSHPYHPSHHFSNQPMHTTICSPPAIMIQYIQSSQYDPDSAISRNTIQPIRSIQPIRCDPPFQKSNKANQDPSSVASLPQHLVIPHILLMARHLIFHPPQRPLPPDICSLPLLLHLLLPSLLPI